MKSITELAEKIGVSPSTVSRALKNDSRISKETKELVIKEANKYGFTPKTYSKKQNKTLKHKTVALVVNTENYPFSNSILTGIEQAFQNSGHNIIVVNSSDNANKEIEQLSSIQNLVQGIIIVPAGAPSSFTSDYLQEVAKKIPVLTLVRSLSIEGIDSMSFDQYTSAFNLVNILIQNGHNNIAFMSGPLRYNPTLNKLSAYTDALRANNIPIKSEYINYTAFNEEEAADKLITLLTKHKEITAVFSANIPITRGCLIGLNRMGWKIPENIALVSHGSEQDYLYYPGGITSVSEKQIDIGFQSGKWMLDKLNNYKYNKKNVIQRLIYNSETHVYGTEKYPIHPISELVNHE